jgi:hypothetical protein
MTTTTTTPGLATTPVTTTTAAPDYNAYVNSQPDLLNYYNAHPTDYGDYNNDGVIDITDFGLGHFNKFGQTEGRVVPGTSTGSNATTPGSNATTTGSNATTTGSNATTATGTNTNNKTNTVTVTPGAGGTNNSTYTSAGGTNSGIYADPTLANSTLTGTTTIPTTTQQMFGGQSPFTGDFGKLVDFYAASSPRGVTPNPASLYNVPTRGESGFFGNKGATTGTTTTTGTNNTSTTTSAPDYAAYVNAYPDLLEYYNAHPTEYLDYNNDGKMDIVDFGMGHWNKFGQAGGRSLTGPVTTTAANGGLMGLGAGGVHMGGGSFVLDARTVAEIGNGSSNAGKEVLARMGGRPLNGPGDGVSDSIPANIGGRQRARVARDEVVMPPSVVARIGKGSPKRGADKLYSLMDRARKARKQAKRGQDTGLRRGLA